MPRRRKIVRLLDQHGRFWQRVSEDIAGQLERDGYAKSHITGRGVSKNTLRLTVFPSLVAGGIAPRERVFGNVKMGEKTVVREPVGPLGSGLFVWKHAGAMARLAAG